VYLWNMHLLFFCSFLLFCIYPLSFFCKTPALISLIFGKI